MSLSRLLARRLAVGTSLALGALALAATPSVVRAAGVADVDPVAPRRPSAEVTKGTYIDEVITARDSIVERWPERLQRPVRVWISDGRGLHGWQPGYVALTRAAFGDWERLGIPVRFVFVSDPRQAEVRVHWVERLGGESCGETRWRTDRAGWVRSANVTLAMHASDGGLQDDAGIKALALHEVGHLLGLDHTADARTIMSPWVEVNDITPADRATVRLLYTLPAGRVI
jgi:hypothetical protein